MNFCNRVRRTKSMNAPVGGGSIDVETEGPAAIPSSARRNAMALATSQGWIAPSNAATATPNPTLTNWLRSGAQMGKVTPMAAVERRNQISPQEVQGSAHVQRPRARPLTIRTPAESASSNATPIQAGRSRGPAISSRLRIARRFPRRAQTKRSPGGVASNVGSLSIW
jgi:hypothetical protein